ncbi:hypothetical protein BJV78DRAFT_1365156 [Lactifluus subvellereus]|nr:hypothetical protein BJV78DRAFT_1365156 [Lactifluus subvellereus]
MAQSPAAIAKEKGNTAFKAGDYVAAVGHYTTAALADPSDPTFFLNRAAAYLKLSKNEDAERDCTTALNLSNKNVKAFFRRAQARTALDKLGEAHNGAWSTYVPHLQRALRIEPNNEAVKTELARVDGLIVAGKGKTRSAPIEVPTPPPLAPGAPRSSTAAATPKRRRVPITIVDNDDTSSPSFQTISTEPTNDDLLSLVSSRVLLSTPPDPKPAPPGAAAAQKPKPASFKEAKQVREDKKYAGRVGGGILRMSGNNTVFKTREVPALADPAASSQTKKPPVAPEPPTQGPSASPLRRAAPTTATARAQSTAPRTLFEFTRAWDSIPASDTGARWALLNVHDPPTSLPALFGASLEPVLLASLVPVLATVTTSLDAVRAYMCALTRVPRFKIVARFLSRAERDAARAVWEAVMGSTDDARAEDVEVAEAAHVWGFSDT